MSRGFGVAAVTTTKGVLMVHPIHWPPDLGRMAGLTGIAGIDVGTALARLIHIIVATDTRTTHFAVIHQFIVQPRLIRIVTRLTHIGTGDVILCLAGSRDPVVTTKTGTKD